MYKYSPHSYTNFVKTGALLGGPQLYDPPEDPVLPRAHVNS